MRLLLSIIFCFLFLPFFAEAQKEYMCIDPSEDDEPVYVELVEKKPAYPGGYEELLKDIYENLVYPEDAKKDSIQGYVFVRFVIDKEGHITNPEILRLHHYAYIDSPAFDSAVLDVLSHLKTFIPGEQHGKKVNVIYTQPIMFKLDK